MKEQYNLCFLFFRSRGDRRLEGDPGLVEPGIGIAAPVPRLSRLLEEDGAEAVVEVREPGIDGDPLPVLLDGEAQLRPGVRALGPSPGGHPGVDLAPVEIGHVVPGV